MTIPSAAGRPRPLQTMFNAVPPHYDLINHMMTLGFAFYFGGLLTDRP